MYSFTRTLLLALALLLPAAVHAQLSGTYTVGGASPDYTTITDAVSDLNAFGISGPVFFQIRSGTYDEQVTISNFPRYGSATDRVTFTRPTPIATRPLWQATGAGLGTNWVVRVNGADYVTFQGLRFEAVQNAAAARLIVLENGADHITVRNSELFGDVSAPSDEGSLIYAKGSTNEYLRIEGNETTYGYRAVDIQAPGTNDRAEGTVVEDNEFFASTVGAVRLRFQRGAVVHGNEVTDFGAADPVNFVGLFADGAGTEITSNTVRLDDGGARGIQLQGFADTDQRLIANNFVYLSGGTVADAGIVLTAGRVDVQHNTVRIIATLAPDAAALRVNTGSMPQVHLRNNLFVNDSGPGPSYESYVLRVPGGNIASSDYNDLYNSTDGPLVAWGGSDYATLHAFQQGTGRDPNSVSKSVTFAGGAVSYDLHLAGGSVGDDDLAGIPLVAIDEDIDGEARYALAPYMGADEAATELTVFYGLTAEATTSLSVAPGGTVSFDYVVTNYTGAPVTGDVYFSLTNATDLVISGTVQAGASYNGSYTQVIPVSVSPGIYVYTINIGNFPNGSVGAVSFPLTVTPPSPRGAEEGAPDAWSVIDVTPWPDNEEISEAASSAQAEAFVLDAAYPNPFASSTTVGFALPEAVDVRIAVYDMLGREVAVLADEAREAGQHTVQFEASELASGVYLVRMTAGDVVQVQRVTLAR